jgi:hypothetical protein
MSIPEIHGIPLGLTGGFVLSGKAIALLPGLGLGKRKFILRDLN